MRNIATAMSEDNKWKAESDLRTLIEAEEIRKDSKRMKAAMAVAKEKREAMTAITEKGTTK